MFIKRFAVLFLTFLLLFADSGQMLYAHTCLKTKHTHYSISTPKHCCADTKAEANCGFKKSTCCEVSSKYLKQNFVRQETVTNETSVMQQNYFPVHVFSYAVTSVTKTSSVFAEPLALLVQSSNVFTQNFRI